MFKATPNPPDINDVSPYESPDSKKFNEAADRALDHYLNPAKAPAPRKPSTMFLIAPDIDSESLLAHACESMASASVMASDFSGELQGPQRHKMLALQQIIMLGDLAVNRALDNSIRRTPDQIVPTSCLKGRSAFQVGKGRGASQAAFPRGAWERTLRARFGQHFFTSGANPLVTGFCEFHTLWSHHQRGRSFPRSAWERL